MKSWHLLSIYIKWNYNSNVKGLYFQPFQEHNGPLYNIIDPHNRTSYNHDCSGTSKFSVFCACCNILSKKILYQIWYWFQAWHKLHLFDNYLSSDFNRNSLKGKLPIKWIGQLISRYSKANLHHDKHLPTDSSTCSAILRGSLRLEVQIIKVSILG